MQPQPIAIPQGDCMVRIQREYEPEGWRYVADRSIAPGSTNYRSIICDRLSAIDYENPKICEQQIRDAFSRHLIALNQQIAAQTI